jgi:hypothetical protein
LLQEVDDGAPRSRHLDLADELAHRQGYPYKAVGHNVALRKGRYGNATLSRFPILRERNIDLTIDTRKRRGCQHTTIEVQRPGNQDAPPGGVQPASGAVGAGAGAADWRVGALEGVSGSRRAPSLHRGRRFQRLAPVAAPDLHGDPALSERHPRRTNTPPSCRPFPRFHREGGWTGSTIAGRCGWSRPAPARLVSAKVASDHLPVVAEFDLHG